MARLASNRPRLLAILAAVLLAGLAAWALFAYTSNVEQQILAERELVDVLVATDAITAGTQADTAAAQGLIDLQPRTRAELPDGAARSLTEIAGRVAAADILAGETIVAERFAVQADLDRRGLRAIDPDKEAVSVEVGVPEGVAGFVSAGDRVSLLAQVTGPGPAPLLQDEDEDTDPVAATQVRYLLQDVEVLAVGQRVVTDGGDQVEATSQVLMTLALTAEDAERVVFAANNGVIHATLLPSDLPEGEGPDRPISTPGRTLDNLFDE